MSTYASNTKIGTLVATDGTLERYTAVKIVAGKLVTAGATDLVFGICDLDNPVADQPVQVVVSGIAKVECSAAIAAGALVSIDSDGKIDAAAAATTDYILGQLIGATGAAGEIGEVYLTKTARFVS
jgi:hypothetical protein